MTSLFRSPCWIQFGCRRLEGWGGVTIYEFKYKAQIRVGDVILEIEKSKSVVNVTMVEHSVFFCLEFQLSKIKWRSLPKNASLFISKKYTQLGEDCQLVVRSSFKKT